MWTFSGEPELAQSLEITPQAAPQALPVAPLQRTNRRGLARAGTADLKACNTGKIGIRIGAVIGHTGLSRDQPVPRRARAWRLRPTQAGSGGGSAPTPPSPCGSATTSSTWCSSWPSDSAPTGRDQRPQPARPALGRSPLCGRPTPTRPTFKGGSRRLIPSPLAWRNLHNH